MHVHLEQHLLNNWPVGVFCHNVCRVVCTQDFDQLNYTCPDLGLCPEVSDVQVSDFAEASAPAHSKCCGCIAVDPNVVGEAEVPCNRLQSESLSNVCINAVQLGLSRRESNGRLSFRPLTDIGSVEEADSS